MNYDSDLPREAWELLHVVFLKLPIIQEEVELIYKILQERKGFQT